jgi:hypothetical protein
VYGKHVGIRYGWWAYSVRWCVWRVFIETVHIWRVCMETVRRLSA